VTGFIMPPAWSRGGDHAVLVPIAAELHRNHAVGSPARVPPPHRVVGFVKLDLSDNGVGQDGHSVISRMKPFKRRVLHWANRPPCLTLLHVVDPMDDSRITTAFTHQIDPIGRLLQEIGMKTQ
jgi:hypothetical protein